MRKGLVDCRYLCTMNLLLTAATVGEIQPLIDHFSLKEGKNEVFNHQVTVLISGVGMTAAAFALGKILASSDFDLAVNAGIAGSFNREIVIGDVLSVQEDIFAELGADDNGRFISLDELGFETNHVFPIAPAENQSFSSLKKVKSITVNKVNGSSEAIESAFSRWHPDIESMEGAAFFYACSQEKLPSVQLRAISNYVEIRNRGNWNIGLAVKNLNLVLIDFLDNLL